MQIIDHKLTTGWYGLSPNHGGALLNPTLLVMHFTASGGDSPKDDADYFMNPTSRVSAHAIVGRNGAVLQVVPFDVEAFHAGVSVWRGVPNCNAYSIGIEFDNWGRLLKTADGKVRTNTGRLVSPGSAVSLTHKHELTPSLWEIYPEAQITAGLELVSALLAAYPSIREIVGHDDVAPGRKIDPGPAFPMGRFTDLLAPASTSSPTTRTVVASTLNARTGPGLQYDVLGVFKHGEQVKVLYDTPGAWAQVEGALASGAPATAWVSDQYLR